MPVGATTSSATAGGTSAAAWNHRSRRGEGAAIGATRFPRGRAREELRRAPPATARWTQSSARGRSAAPARSQRMAAVAADLPRGRCRGSDGHAGRRREQARAGGRAGRAGRPVEGDHACRVGATELARLGQLVAHLRPPASRCLAHDAHRCASRLTARLPVMTRALTLRHLRPAGYGQVDPHRSARRRDDRSRAQSRRARCRPIVAPLGRLNPGRQNQDEPALRRASRVRAPEPIGRRARWRRPLHRGRGAPL